METITLDYHSETDKALGLLLKPELLNKILADQKGGPSPPYESMGEIDQFFIKREISGRIIAIVVDHGWAGYHTSMAFFAIEDSQGNPSNRFLMSIKNDLNLENNALEITKEIVYLLKWVLAETPLGLAPIISGDWGHLEIDHEASLRIRVNLEFKQEKLFDF